MDNRKLATNKPATTAVAPKPKAFELLASSLKIDASTLHKTLKNTVFKGASDEELAALVIVANVYGLNPITKEIWAFPDKKRGGIVPVVSIDGWIKIINRQEAFDGLEFKMDWQEIGEGDKAKKIPFACTCVLYIKGRTRPIEVTEYYDECYRSVGTDGPWDKMPSRMLRHKSLIQAGRYAFGFAGIYDEDEAKDIINVTATVVPAAPEFLGAPSGEPTTGEPEQEREQAPERSEPEPRQVEVGPEVTIETSFAELREKLTNLCKSSNVSLDQVLAWAKVNKLAKSAQNEVWEMATAKLVDIINRWGTILPDIEKITI